MARSAVLTRERLRWATWALGIAAFVVAVAVNFWIGLLLFLVWLVCVAILRRPGTRGQMRRPGGETLADAELQGLTLQEQVHNPPY